MEACTRAHSFVRIPQARSRHHPRSASKKAKPPAANSTMATQGFHENASTPRPAATTPQSARAMRPARVMLGLKNPATCND